MATIKDQKSFFNNSYDKWVINLSDENKYIVKKVVDLLDVKKGSALLDVGAGTGILFWALQEKELSNYLAIDISEKMLEELVRSFPKAKTICMDFDKEVKIDDSFDYIVIYNSIPHFENLGIVFENVYNLLKNGGKFSIAHGRTREGLKEHHKKIGYNHGKEPIPNDNILKDLSERYSFQDVVLKDDEFFFFSCVKKEDTSIRIIPFTKEYQNQAKELILQGIEEYVGKLESGFNLDLDDIEENYKGHVFLITLKNGNVIATGGLLLDGDASQIVRVSVKKEYRKQGLGKRIVEGLTNYAVKNESKKIIVETSKDWVNAINFYLKLGFEFMYCKDEDIYFKYDKL